jgi:hypothetical protein
MARIIGPVFASNGFQHGGGRLVFGTMAGLMLLCTIILTASYRILKPNPATSTTGSINKAPE